MTLTALPRRSLCLLGLAGAVAPRGLLAAGAVPVRFQPGDDPAASEVWRKVQASLFDGRPVATAAPGQLVLSAPLRAIDGAVVPVALRAADQVGGAAVRRLYLVVDANPSPVGVVLQTDADAHRPEVELRVRVDDYSHIRAVAELADGRLVQTVRFIKASGGCSAPPGADLAAARATMGRVALRVEGDLRGSAAVQAQLGIQHPNHSGMAMDQFTRQVTPPHFVRKVSAQVDGREVFNADVDFSVSENPSFRFWFRPGADRAMRVLVEDSQGLRFDAVHPFATPAA